MRSTGRSGRAAGSRPSRRREHGDLAGPLAASQLGVEGLGVALAAEHLRAVAPGLAPAHPPDHLAVVALEAFDAPGDDSSRRASSTRKLPAAGEGTGGYAIGRSAGCTAQCSIHSSNAARGIRRREHRARGAQLTTFDRPVDRARRQPGQRGGLRNPQERRLVVIDAHAFKEAIRPRLAPFSDAEHSAANGRNVYRTCPFRTFSSERSRGLRDTSPGNRPSPPSDSNR